MLLTISSSITDVSSTNVETLRRDLRSSIHLNRKINPYTGLEKEEAGGSQHPLLSLPESALGVGA